MHADGITPIVPSFRAVGFKSFPEHWIDVRNEDVWRENILEDIRVKKIVLRRKDELAVFVSMKRADATSFYMTHSYPKDLVLEIDPAEFQRFLNNYRNTFRNKYVSPLEKRDTFHITYEDLVCEEHFEEHIAPRLWDFLGVRNDLQVRRLRETVKQADADEDLSQVISNYEELEFCFRFSDVLHFKNRREEKVSNEAISEMQINDECETLASWSLLVPICSRPKISQAQPPHDLANTNKMFNSNRFIDLTVSSQYNPDHVANSTLCWELLRTFAHSLKSTSSAEQLSMTECIVGIDVDDPLYYNDEARHAISNMMPCRVEFVDIQPHMYGHVCKIWNLLGKNASNDFIVLLGDDIKLLDDGWQSRIVQKFCFLARSESLPFGAACVCLNDTTFPGFPTFPVVHRWHIQRFRSILPKQFANQGGDPYLYELYSRYRAAAFEVSCRLQNMIGGDGDARYQKHQINWRGQILSMNLRFLKSYLQDRQPHGVCIDVVVPCYRVDNEDFLRRIVCLRATVPIYVKFWIVVDNPLKRHIESVQKLAAEMNEQCVWLDCNYFVNVIHYGENRGASYARNTGFNYSTADWILFLDDDVIPDPNLLDAYVGAIKRFPEGKVFVGMTELPPPSSLFTEMLRTCNVGYFYSIAQRKVHPSWGVTANMMVRGSRYNSTIQFKAMYPKTGGGEDIDFVYQFKEWYRTFGRPVTVGVPEAVVRHPWWNKGGSCYKQIMGWAWGDSICITEWPQKTFLTCPNWIEHTLFVLPLVSLYTGRFFCGVRAGLGIVVTEHLLKCFNYYPEGKKTFLWGTTEEYGCFVRGWDRVIVTRAYPSDSAGMPRPIFLFGKACRLVRRR